MDDKTQMELAERIAPTVKDQITAERLLGFAKDLRQRLQDWQTAKERPASALTSCGNKQVVRLEEEEFWLTAERELDTKENEVGTLLARPLAPARSLDLKHGGGSGPYSQTRYAQDKPSCFRHRTAPFDRSL